MRPTGARCEYQYMQSTVDQTQGLISPLAVVPTSILDDQRAIPFKPRRQLERDSASDDISLVLNGIETDGHLIIVYTYIQ